MAKNLEISYLLDFYGEMLTKKQHDFLIYYYDDDLSLSEIAENEGITRQGVRDQIKRAEQRLASLEEKCHYCERFLRLKELADDFKSGDKNAAEQIVSIIEEL